jgi:hypothetical protein
MDKRAELRRFFQEKENQSLQTDRFEANSAQFRKMNDNIIKSFIILLDFLDGKVTKTEITNQLESISTPDVLKLSPKLDDLKKSVDNAKIDLKPVLEALNGLKREMSLIPKKLPDQKDDIKVNNLSEVKLDTSKVEKAIKELKLDPKIDIKAPIINVDKPDLKPIQDVMLDVLKAIKAIEMPEVKIPEQVPTDLSKVEKKLDESNKHLKTISEKKFGGGGGGGNGTPYVDQTGKLTNPILNADGSISVSDVKNKKYSYILDTVTVGLVHTITLTRTDVATSVLETKVSVIDTSDNSITESAWV